MRSHFVAIEPQIAQGARDPFPRRSSGRRADEPVHDGRRGNADHEPGENTGWVGAARADGAYGGNAQQDPPDDPERMAKVWRARHDHGGENRDPHRGVDRRRPAVTIASNVWCHAVPARAPATPARPSAIAAERSRNADSRRRLGVSSGATRRTTAHRAASAYPTSKTHVIHDGIALRSTARLSSKDDGPGAKGASTTVASRLETRRATSVGRRRSSAFA